MSTTAVLDAAEALFYQRGIQAVGMDDIRTESGVSLKRLYQLFPSKEALVVGYLERRDERWRRRLAEFVDAHHGPKILLVFDWLYEWFTEPDFRGCAFINSFGEMGTRSPAIMSVVRHHKKALRAYLVSLCQDVPLAEQILLLIDGAITIAAITGDPDAAWRARAAAVVLVSG
ncbi:TetR/AcrR family transcriptional regulator [Actinocrispum wychmicini]|uniref:TetR family transcriptional regulator n=1 Tax=Actinocrispum wychmicini TaxID=1213861 RepID=A0A4R2JU33_9PSEU|nr:TetR/AcrR family transcriptional regulator [Actinocrispum wychmicini]TCO62687.1 TetR family transcriptional regulator [Actinocrispum wychmicini]